MFTFNHHILSDMLWLYGNTKRADKCNENNQCHMTWGCLSTVFEQSFCAKLELPSSKNNEIEEINVLPKFICRAPLSGDSSARPLRQCPAILLFSLEKLILFH